MTARARNRREGRPAQSLLPIFFSVVVAVSNSSFVASAQVVGAVAGSSKAGSAGTAPARKRKPKPKLAKTDAPPLTADGAKEERASAGAKTSPAAMPAAVNGGPVGWASSKATAPNGPPPKADNKSSDVPASGSKLLRTAARIAAGLTQDKSDTTELPILTETNCGLLCGSAAGDASVRPIPAAR